MTDLGARCSLVAMKYPASERVGMATAPDGGHYALDFHGEDEGAAVVSGPVPSGQIGSRELPEVYRVLAISAEDARAQLSLWCDGKGWRLEG